MFNQSNDISLHHMASLASIPASQWSIDSSNFDQTSMSTHPPFACFLPSYQSTSTRHSYHMGDPFVHGYSHMGYTFEGLTGRMSTNEIGERMHEARFRQVQMLPQEDDIFAWLIQPRGCTLNVTTITPCHLWTSGPAPGPPSLVSIHIIQHHSPRTPYWSSVLSLLHPCLYLLSVRIQTQ